MALSMNKFMSLLLAGICTYYQELCDESLIPRDVPQEEVKKEYDFIIVGGGSTGCVLANRLSENPDWDILVAEAGGDETPLSNVPMAYNYNLFNLSSAWNFTTVKQKKVCRATNGICKYPRGKVLGGTSVIFPVIYQRGSKKDLNNLKFDDWTYDEVLPYYRKGENATNLRIPKSVFHGYSGPQNVQYPLYRTELKKEYIKAGEELGWIFRDYNGETQENTIDYPQMPLTGASKESAAKAYLYPIKNRKNLHIIKFSFVIKIIIKNEAAVGIEYVRDDKKYRVKAKKEVILSCGVFGNPKLLMLSGIGPKEELNKHDIKVIKELPVGKNYQDQLGVDVPFKINETLTFTTNIWQTEEAIEQYVKNKSGPLTATGLEAMTYNVNSEGYTTHWFRFNSIRWKYDGPQLKDVITVTVSIMRPESNGTVTLKSNNPYDYLLIDPNYLSSKKDYYYLKDGIKTVLKFMKTSTMKKYSPKYFPDDQSLCEDKEVESKEWIDCLIRNYATTSTRLCGTTRMGDENDPDVAVTTNLEVIGIKNLRVVGSSNMPNIPTGGTYGIGNMLAEKSSDIIKSKYMNITKPSQPNYQGAMNVFQLLVQEMLTNKNFSSPFTIYG